MSKLAYILIICLFQGQVSNAQPAMKAKNLGSEVRQSLQAIPLGPQLSGRLSTDGDTLNVSGVSSLEFGQYPFDVTIVKTDPNGLDRVLSATGAGKESLIGSRLSTAISTTLKHLPALSMLSSGLDVQIEEIDVPVDSIRTLQWTTSEFTVKDAGGTMLSRDEVQTLLEENGAGSDEAAQLLDRVFGVGGNANNAMEGDGGGSGENPPPTTQPCGDTTTFRVEFEISVNLTVGGRGGSIKFAGEACGTGEAVVRDIQRVIDLIDDLIDRFSR